MPDFADSSGAVIAIIAESTFDTTPASPGFQKLRFTSESLNYTPNRVTSNEITTNAGVSDLVEVGAQNAGDISFEWSYGADFDLILEGSLRATFTTGTTTAGVTVTGVEALGSTAIGVTTDGTGDVSLGNAIQVLSDLEVLRDMVAEIAGEAETFNKAALEQAAKNLREAVRWQIEWGGEEKRRMIEAMLEDGREVRALARKPELNQVTGDYFRHFWTLSNARQAGMAENPIQLSEIDAYCRFQGIDDGEEREELLFLMQQMDGEYLKARSERSERRPKAGKAPRLG